jgi:protein TonB
MMIDTFETAVTRQAINELPAQTVAPSLKGPRQVLWITPDVIREKQPAVDLKQQYNRTFGVSVALTLILHVTVVLASPQFDLGEVPMRGPQMVIAMEDIPETRQIKRPPPLPRPAVPIETESEDVPDDVTIESTDLDFDDALLNLSPPPPPGSRGNIEALEEEVVEFWAVEEAPVSIREVYPKYPEIARRAGLEGTVFVQFVVGLDGTVKQVSVVRGPQMFRQSAVDAVMLFLFKPALQNDKPVQVRMTRPIRFRLDDGG